MRKLDYKQVKTLIENTGYTLISNTYTKSKDKIEICCPKGHKYKVTFDSFKRGSRCSTCKGNKPYTLQEARQLLELENITLLNDSLSGVHDKLHIVCHKGHRCTITLNTFLHKGTRCTVCSGRYTNTYTEIVSHLAKYGYTLTTKKDKYRNNTQSLDVICPNRHKWSVSFSDFKKGIRCNKCAHNKKLTLSEARKIVEERNLILLSGTYKDSSSRLELLCGEGHKFLRSIDVLKKTSCCPICTKSNSSGERLIYNILEELITTDKFIPEYRVTINGSIRLFDFYIKADTPLFIEYDGIQHFKPIEFFGGLAGYRTTVERDHEKNQYVMDNGYHILRVNSQMGSSEVYEQVTKFLTKHNAI